MSITKEERAALLRLEADQYEHIGDRVCDLAICATIALREHAAEQPSPPAEKQTVNDVALLLSEIENYDIEAEEIDRYDEIRFVAPDRQVFVTGQFAYEEGVVTVDLLPAAEQPSQPITAEWLATFCKPSELAPTVYGYSLDGPGFVLKIEPSRTVSKLWLVIIEQGENIITLGAATDRGYVRTLCRALKIPTKASE